MNRLYITTVIVLLATNLFANASTTNSKSSELISLVKQQQYLAQKVSKYYVDLQSDLKNFKKKEKMKTTISNFHKNHLKLIRHTKNTKAITKKLTKVDKIWKIAYKLSETKKHSVMIITAMNDISGKMKELRKLYKKTSR